MFNKKMQNDLMDYISETCILQSRVNDLFDKLNEKDKEIKEIKQKVVNDSLEFELYKFNLEYPNGRIYVKNHSNKSCFISNLYTLSYGFITGDGNYGRKLGTIDIIGSQCDNFLAYSLVKSESNKIYIAVCQENGDKDKNSYFVLDMNKESCLEIDNTDVFKDCEWKELVQ